jgi:Transposase DDE domain
LKRRSRLKRYRRWIKLTVVCEHQTHLIAAAVVNLGPSNDASHFSEAVQQAAAHLRLSSLSADGAYDSEHFHALCREELGMRCTAIPINSRGSDGPVKSGPYRLEMQDDFPTEIFRQRWQIESTFSQFKRLLGDTLTATSHEGRVREVLLRVVTHNLTILGFGT